MNLQDEPTEEQEEERRKKPILAKHIWRNHNLEQIIENKDKWVIKTKKLRYTTLELGEGIPKD